MANENKPVKILLVDDDDFLIEMYAVKFKSCGYTVDAAKNAQEALEKAKEHNDFDVILLDLVMPQMNGFELLEAAKKNNLFGRSAVIVLSNLNQQEDINRCKELGVTDFIVKAGHTPSEVVERVNKILKKETSPEAFKN